MGTKGIDQRPYDRDKFNSNFDAIFGKKENKKKEIKVERRTNAGRRSYDRSKEST